MFVFLQLKESGVGNFFPDSDSDSRLLNFFSPDSDSRLPTPQKKISRLRLRLLNFFSSDSDSSNMPGLPTPTPDSTALVDSQVRNIMPKFQSFRLNGMVTIEKTYIQTPAELRSTPKENLVRSDWLSIKKTSKNR